MPNFNEGEIMFNTIQNDYKNARVGRNKQVSATLSTLVSEIKRTLQNPSDTPTDEMVTTVIKKSIKNLNELLEAKKRYGTDITNEVTEIHILEKYLPKQLTRDELKTIIADFCTLQQIENIRQMGMVMKYMASNYKDQYDGKVVSEIVKEIINEK